MPRGLLRRRGEPQRDDVDVVGQRLARERVVWVDPDLIPLDVVDPQHHRPTLRRACRERGAGREVRVVREEATGDGLRPALTEPIREVRRHLDGEPLADEPIAHRLLQPTDDVVRTVQADHRLFARCRIVEHLARRVLQHIVKRDHHPGLDRDGHVRLLRRRT